MHNEVTDVRVPGMIAFYELYIILLGNLISPVSILPLLIVYTFLIWGNNDYFIKLVTDVVIRIQKNLRLCYLTALICWVFPSHPSIVQLSE